MYPVLETSRLAIRPFTLDDLLQFKKLLDNPGVPGWQKQIPHAENFLHWHLSKYDKLNIITDIVCFGIFNRLNGIALGAVGAGEHDDLHEPEIFYNILPDFQGNGYATEAAKAVTKWAIENFDVPYLIGTADVDNIASQCVLEKCGYILVDTKELLVHALNEKGIFKYYRYYRGEEI
jgi:RimJ/RimL family protein N-acetyltransferase